MYILDTNHLSEYIQPKSPKGQNLKDRIDANPSARIVTSVVVCMELVQRYTSRYQSATDDAYKRTALDHLNRLIDILQKFTRLEYDDKTDAKYRELERRYAKTGWNVNKHNDLKVAATALVYGATVLTANIKDFESIRGLKIENWLEPL